MNDIPNKVTQNMKICFVKSGQKWQLTSQVFYFQPMTGKLWQMLTSNMFPNLFPVEVGARGYPSRIQSCLRKLGFPNKSARSTSKILGNTSMLSSFYIWLARNTRSWGVEHMFLPTKPSPTNQASGQNSQRFSGTSQNIISKEASISTASKQRIF